MMDEHRDALDELLSEPIVQLLMARDNVTAVEVRTLLEAAHRRGEEAEAMEAAEEQENLPEPHMLPAACLETCLCC